MRRFLIPVVLAIIVGNGVFANPVSAGSRRLSSFTLSTPKRPAYERAVVLLGDPNGGTQGTGVVVSRKHRLVVTNSHVAELYIKTRRMSAMVNGTRQSYRVKRIWYHPGILRQLRREKTLVVRSSNPYDGPTAIGCPDIALLQLETTGPALPAEMVLATPDELRHLQGQEIRIFGYPMTDTKRWPRTGEIVRATIDKGTIRNLYNFEFSARENDAENQFVQHSISTIGGFSGSPLFLANGHIVAIHNSSIVKLGRKMGHGIRIDCLWELLVHHKLTDKLPIPVSPAKLSLARWTKKLPDEDKKRKALKLAKEGASLIYDKQDYAAGVEKCNAALKLVKFGYAYRTRGTGYANYYFDQNSRLSYATSLKYLRLALEDAEQYLKLCSNDDTVDAVLTLCLVLNNLGNHTRNTSFNSKALAQLDKVMKLKNLSSYDEARLHSSRGIALSNLGRLSEATKEHNKAVAMRPNDPVLLENRADYWRSHGYSRRANADFAKARELRKKK